MKSAQTRWLERIFSTKPANREQAEEAVQHTYLAGGVPEPEIFLWFDDLMEALLVTEQLSDYRESNWMLPPESLRRREKVQRRVRNKLGLRTWKKVVQAVGPEHRANRYETRQHLGIGFRVAVPRKDSLQAGLRTAANDSPCGYDVIEQAAAVVGRAGITSYLELVRIVDCAAGPGVPGHGGIGHVPSIFDDYRLEMLFRHACLLSICGERASAAYDGLCRTVQHCGPWWAFANAAILRDRPREARRDSGGRLHNDKGPAVTFRNGVQLFAWHGSWIPEEAIRHPESLTRSVIRAEGDPELRQSLIEMYGAERYESERRPPPDRKPRNPLLIVLPDAVEEKIEVLRSNGPLPCYERYLAGEHRQVWRELGALGAGVRGDQYAADALAVAYATMTRVRQNIATIIERLREIGYEFEAESGDRNKVIPYGVARWNLWMNVPPERPTPFQPPEPGRAHLRRLERDAGELPISLRAWYEVVGSVTLLGEHPVLSPGDGTLVPDPLVIVPFSQIFRAWDDSPPDVGVEGKPFVAEIGPDATCKARRSGKSYLITLPSVGMDALLENERHGLSFVDYLRLALQWGGFPGFESAGQRPKEVEFVSNGLLSF